MPSWHKCIYVTTAGKFMVRNFPDTRFGHSCCYDSFKPRLIIILIILAAKLYFLYRFSCFTYLHNLSNWSHDWQQISLELGKLLQKNTKLHFIFFHSLHSKKGSFNPTIPTLSQAVYNSNQSYIKCFVWHLWI